MAVVASDLGFRLSGGAANANVNASLGGVISSVAVSFGDTFNNLFDNVSDVEASAGDNEYRCIYLRNNHATDTLNDVKLFIASNTPSTSTKVQVGLDPAGIGGTATTVANENTAPAGVTFADAANSGAALSIGNLGPGGVQAVWIKREVTAGAAAAANDPFTLRVTGTPA